MQHFTRCEAGAAAEELASNGNLGSLERRGKQPGKQEGRRDVWEDSSSKARAEESSAASGDPHPPSPLLELVISTAPRGRDCRLLFMLGTLTPGGRPKPRLARYL